MVVLDNMKIEIQGLKPTLDEVTASLDIETKKKRIEELNREMEEPTFWDDADKANKKTKELKNMQDLIEKIENLNVQYGDIIDMIDMCNDEGTEDDDMAAEIRADLDEFKTVLEEIRIANLLNGEYDKCNAILKLSAGAGGTEACDWCSMLYRMYTRWADKHKMKLSVLDLLDGEEAGIKSVTFQVEGFHAYGYLKSEHGVHRLVRISPFNAAGKRQTSFCSVDVMPVIDDSIEIEVNDDDLRIDTYRASGAGGQHINKTSSAIRITHLPTGIVVQCQNERSQHQNKDTAMKMLKAKLYLMEKAKQDEQLSGIRGEVTENGFGSQIRSYVLQPYTMVKDLRTGCEMGDAGRVLDGDIDSFINAYLAWMATGGKTE